MLKQQIYHQQTGVKISHRYEFDYTQVQLRKQQIDEFLFYRKKFEKSQRAKAANSGGAKHQVVEGIAPLNLDKEMFDPKNMQQ